MTRFPLAVLAIALALLPAFARAECGTGNPPSYDDIEAVLLKQNGCGGNIGSFRVPGQSWQLRSSLECSAYWLFFWQSGPSNFPTTYSQFNLKNSVGTYRLSATLADAKAILRNDAFFALSPHDGYRTDTAEAVLLVRRCAIVTSVSIFTGSGNAEPEAAKVFADLSNLIRVSTRTKISDIPQQFELGGLFDPLPF